MSVAVTSDPIEQDGCTQHVGPYGKIAERFRKAANKVLSKEKSPATICSLVEGSYAYAEAAISKVRAKKPPTQAIQCQAGCSYCCTLVVSVTAPQIVYLVRGMRDSSTREELDRAIRDVQIADDQTRRLSSTERYVNRRPCPLLRDGLCIAYASRPSACRGHTSYSWLACLREYKLARTFKYTPIAADRSGIYWAIQSGFLSALDDNGIPPQILELNAALRIAFDTPNFENRWLAGEAIFNDAILRR